MNIEERELRDALRTRADAVPVGRADEAALARRLAAGRRRRRQRLLAGATVALVVALGAASLLTTDDGPGDNVVAGPDTSSTTVVEPSTSIVETTSVAPTTATLPAPPPTSTTPGSAGAVTTASPLPRITTTTAPLPPVPDDALWPPPGSGTTFTAPERAAADFARRFLGMGTPQVGAPRVSGATAAVDLRALPTAGLTSVVSLRQVDRRGWVVVGCAAASIQVDQPAVGATVASPLTVRGRAQAFEGHVAVEVRSDGATAPIGQSFGTGGGTEVLPFEAVVTFARPAAPRGAVVASEPRADVGDQGPAAATVVRVGF